MAAVTEHLGFGITAGTAFEHPYPFARRLSTLDHLTNGRIGWNVVTGYLPSAARNMGEDDQLQHDDRYDHADEYLEVLYKLWETSWEDDAVVRDRTTGVYTDPAKVHPIEHEGKHFTVPGIHISEPSPQRTPVIFQAGASPRGVRFAAENAEAIFVGAPTKAILKDTVARIRNELTKVGRDPYSARIYTLLTIITDRTPELAQAKLEDYRSYASSEGALVFTSGWMGIDLSGYRADEPIGNVESNAIQSAVASFRQADEKGGEWTVGDIAEVGGHRRARPDRCRFRRGGRRRVAGVGVRDRRRRVQSRVRGDSRNLRRHCGACDSGADQTRCLPERLRRGNAAQQTVRARGQAPARTPRPELRPDPHCRLSGDLRTNRTRVREPRW